MLKINDPKDPLDGIEIQEEHKLIIQGKSKLPQKQKDRVIALKNLDDKKTELMEKQQECLMLGDEFNELYKIVNDLSQ